MAAKAEQQPTAGEDEGEELEPNRYTTIELAQNEYGDWVATQEGVDLVGVHENAALAVSEYAEQVARQKGGVEIND